MNLQQIWEHAQAPWKAEARQTLTIAGEVDMESITNWEDFVIWHLQGKTETVFFYGMNIGHPVQGRCHTQHKFESMEKEGERKAEGTNLGRQEGAQNTKILKTNYLEPIYIWGMMVELTCFFCLFR